MNRRAVMSREVVIKHLSMSERLQVRKTGGDVLGVRRPLDAQHLAMMPGVSTMKVEGSKFPDEMIGCAPDLNVRIMRDRNVPRNTSTLSGGPGRYKISVPTFHLEKI